MKKPILKVSRLSKSFKTLNRKKGFIGSLKNLFSRDYKITKALNNVNFKIEEGEFVGIIGPNGAGKSTLIKSLTGILTPDRGGVKALGLVPYQQRKDYTKNIGVVFGQRTQLWWDLPVKDSFEMLKSIYRIPNEVYDTNMKKFFCVLGIDKFFSTPVRKLSLGERMRCDIAASLLHNPKLVFLDEPTIGLDVEAKHMIRNFLKELNESGTTIILTTHDMDDIEELCPRIVIIDKGKKIYDGSVNSVKKVFGSKKILEIDFFGGVDCEKFNWKGVKLLEKKGDIIKLSVNTKTVPASKIIKRILSKWQVQDITIEEPDIEDIIRKIYKKGI